MVARTGTLGTFNIFDSGGSETVSYNNNGSGSDQCLVVAIATKRSGDQPTVTGITYNGVAMTLAVQRAATTNGQTVPSIWVLPAPATGSNNLTISYTSTGGTGLAVIVQVYNTVNQVDPVGATNTGTTSTGTSNGSQNLSFGITTEEADSCVVLVAGPSTSYTVPSDMSLIDDVSGAFDNSGSYDAQAMDDVDADAAGSKTYLAPSFTTTVIVFAIAELKDKATEDTGQTEDVGLASETNTAFSIAHSKTRAVGLASETDAALSVQPNRSIPVGLTTETDAAFAIGHSKTLAVGLASETDTAFSVFTTEETPVGLASETDQAFSIARLKTRAVGLTPETDAALSVRPNRIKNIVGLDATEAAFSIRPAKGRINLFVQELDEALAIIPLIQTALGLATETDTAFSIAHAKSKQIGIATEVDFAQVIDSSVVGGARLLNGWTLLSSAVVDPGSFAVSASSSGADRFLLYKVAIRDGPGTSIVTAVTYGGQPMSPIGAGVSNGAGAEIISSVWGLDDAGIQAAVGTSFVITRANEAGIAFRAHAASYAGVDQETPIVDFFTAIGNSGVAPIPEVLATLPRGIAVAWLSGADQVGGTSDTTWNNMIERLETPASNIYVSVAAIATSGNSMTPDVSLVNQGNTILQAIAFSPSNVAIIEPIAQALETDTALAVGANAPTIELIGNLATIVDAATLQFTGLNPADADRALVVGVAMTLDQSAPGQTANLDQVTMVYGGTALRRLDSFGTSVDKDRAFLLAFALDRPLLLPPSGDLTITLDMGGSNFEAAAAIAVFVQSTQQLTAESRGETTLITPGPTAVASGTFLPGGLALSFTATASTAQLTGDVKWATRSLQQAIDGPNTSVQMFLEDRFGGGGGSFAHTTRSAADAQMRTIVIQLHQVPPVIVAVGLASETSSAEAVGHSKTKGAGEAVETDVALSVRPLRTRAIGIASEIDFAFPHSAVDITTLNLALETDTALSVRPMRTRAIGLASEADLAFSVSASINSLVTLLDAWTLVTSAAVSAVAGVGNGTSSGPNRLKIVAIGEESTSHEPTAVLYGGKSMTLLTSPMPVIGGFPLTLSFWGLFEADLATRLDNVIQVTTDGLHDGSFRLYSATYTNVRQSPSPLRDYDSSTGNGTLSAARTIDVSKRGRAIAMFGDGTGAAGTNVTWSGTSEQIETATLNGSYFSISDVSTVAGQLTITAASPVVANNALIAISLIATPLPVAVGIAESDEDTIAYTVIKTRSTGLVSETDQAFSITPVFKGRIAVNPAAETDTAFPIEAIQDRIIRQAVETDIALPINPFIIVEADPDVTVEIDGTIDVLHAISGNIARIYGVDGTIAKVHDIQGELL